MVVGPIGDDEFLPNYMGIIYSKPVNKDPGTLTNQDNFMESKKVFFFIAQLEPSKLCIQKGLGSTTATRFRWV